MKIFFRLLQSNSGATAVEYGLLASLISVGMLVGLGGFSDALLVVLDKISAAITSAPV